VNRFNKIAKLHRIYKSPAMEHHVYFWLKDEFKTEAGAARMEAALAELVKSPNIFKAHWGKPAATESRPVTDHSWDYGISLHFATMEAHEKYQKADPIHDAFSGNHREMWAKVLVMDLA
jgi:hypothetical protein